MPRFTPNFFFMNCHKLPVLYDTIAEFRVYPVVGRAGFNGLMGFLLFSLSLSRFVFVVQGKKSIKRRVKRKESATTFLDVGDERRVSGRVGSAPAGVVFFAVGLAFLLS